MSEIPFITALGDALETAIVNAGGAPAPRPRRGLHLPRPRGRLLVVFAVLAVAGAAGAHTLLSSNEQLAAGYVNCSFGTTHFAHGVEGVIHSSASPIAACRREYLRMGQRALTRPGVSFIACRQDANDVDVFIATGDPQQCQEQGLSPLPNGYVTSADRINALQRALGALQREHDCIPRDVLVREVRAALSRLGFVGWRPTSDSISSTGGPCAQFPGTDTTPSDPYLALQSYNRTVLIGQGPPLSIGRLIDRVEPRLIEQSATRCLTPETAHALIRATFAGSPLTPRFATSAELKGEGFNAARQLRYDNGCTVIVTTWPATDDRHVNIWLNNKDAPHLPAGQAAPTAYR